MTAPGAFVLVALMFFWLGVLIGSWAERTDRREDDATLRAQLAALAATLHLSGAAWEARQELHQAAAEERQRQQGSEGC